MSFLLLELYTFIVYYADLQRLAKKFSAKRSLSQTARSIFFLMSLDASFISDNTATCTTSTGSGGCTSAWSAVWTSSPPRPSMTRAQAGLPSLMSSTKRTFARGRTHPEVKASDKRKKIMWKI